MLHPVFLAFSLLLFATPSRADAHEALSVLGHAGIERLQFQGDPTVARATLEPADADSPRRWRIVIQDRTMDAWEIQLSAPIDQAVAPNDVLLLRFRAKGTGQRESGEARAEVTLEQPAEPFNRAFTFPFSVGPNWTAFSLPLRNAEELPTGTTFLTVRLGYAKQTIEIAELEVVNYGPHQNPSQLPRVLPTYAGIEPDAPWRRDAQARIEQYRKGTLTAVVVRADGTPVPDAQVEMRMVRQGFGFGTAVSASRLVTDEPNAADNDRYRRTVERLFNMVNFENELKWKRWDNRDRRIVFQAMDWLEARSIQVRGCCLVWAGWPYLPEHLRLSANNPLELGQRVDSHIRDIVVATQGRIAEWDVVNEPYANHLFTDLLGRERMVDWFKLVRRYDTRPTLYLNDYAGLMAGGEDSAHKHAFEETLRFLKAEGAPIGGLGIQAHFGWDLTPPERLLSELDRWAALGLKIAITEFDVDITDDTLQGQYVRDFLTAVFSHPATDSIGIWGFWEKNHWQPNAALFRGDWSVKPAGQAWIDLVERAWRTTLTLTTNAQGLATGRGFAGDYTVTATAGSSSVTREVSLSREGTRVLLHLPE